MRTNKVQVYVKNVQNIYSSIIKETSRNCSNVSSIRERTIWRSIFRFGPSEFIDYIESLNFLREDKLYKLIVVTFHKKKKKKKNEKDAEFCIDSYLFSHYFSPSLNTHPYYDIKRDIMKCKRETNCVPALLSCTDRNNCVYIFVLHWTVHLSRDAILMRFYQFPSTRLICDVINGSGQNCAELQIIIAIILFL